MSAARTKWYHELTRYHWFVLMVAALGWLFDCLDQHLFNLARRPAMMELLAPSPGVAPAAEAVNFYGPLATSIFLIGWGTGGLAFGVLGDRIGRARTMLWTILIYSLFTGPERAVGRLLGFCLLSVSDRVGRGRRIRGRRGAGG